MVRKKSLAALCLSALLAASAPAQPHPPGAQASPGWTTAGLLKGGLRSLTCAVKSSGRDTPRPKNQTVIAGIRA